MGRLDWTAAKKHFQPWTHVAVNRGPFRLVVSRHSPVHVDEAFPQIVESCGRKFCHTKMTEGGLQQFVDTLLGFVQVSPIVPAVVIDNQLQQARHVDEPWASRLPASIFGEFSLEQFHCFGIVGRMGRFPHLRFTVPIGKLPIGRAWIGENAPPAPWLALPDAWSCGGLLKDLLLMALDPCVQVGLVERPAFVEANFAQPIADDLLY